MEPILLGTLIAGAYGLVLFGFIKLSGIKYTDIHRSEQTLMKGVIMPVAMAGSLLVALSAWNGWLIPAFIPPFFMGDTWAWVVPGAVILGIAARLVRTKWTRMRLGYMFTLACAVVLVGITEELLIRGLLVHFMSQAEVPQYIVMIGSSFIFGLLHGMNRFNGQDRKTTISQMYAATVMGIALYASYVLSGTLWVPIILHALYDLSLLALRACATPTADPPSRIELLSALTLYTGAGILVIHMTATSLLD